MKRAPVLHRAIERMLLARPRAMVRRQMERQLKATLSAIETTTDTRAKYERLNARDVVRLFDAALFCLMYNADLTVLSHDMICHTDWWKSRLYGRLLAMTMWECVEDIPQVLAKDFRASLSRVVSDPEHLRKITSVTKALANFRNRHEPQLTNIRKVAAAHRDHDVNLVIASIESLDIGTLTVLTKELNRVLADFTNAMCGVVEDINVFREILRGAR